MLRRALALAALAAIGAAPAAAQPTADFRWEKALPAGQQVRIQNLNGDVTVSPSTSGKVEVVGMRRGGGADDVSLDIIETSRGIIVCPVYRDTRVECDEDGIHTRGRRGRDRDDDDDWDRRRIDISVKVPKELEVSAGSVSGDVSVAGAEGDVRASSVSGDVRMEGLRATSVRASSVSGNVDVVVRELTGTGLLSFTSVSGDVRIDLPTGTNADVSLRTVSGTLESDFAMVLNGRAGRRNLEARIGKGGRELELRTVSGDVRIREIK